MVVDAAKEFRDSFNGLSATAITDEQQAGLETFYSEQFIPKLTATSGKTPAVAGYLPTSNAQRYLQYHYSIGTTDFDKLIAVDDAGDGSAYSAAHRTYHP